MTEKFLMVLLAIMKFVADIVATVLGYVRERKWRTWRRRVMEAKVRGVLVFCGSCGHEMLPRDVSLWYRNGEPCHDKHKPHFTLVDSMRIYCRAVGLESQSDYGDIGMEAAWPTQSNPKIEIPPKRGDLN